MFLQWKLKCKNKENITDNYTEIYWHTIISATEKKEEQLNQTKTEIIF